MKTIALNMLVWNEEDLLSRCLDSVLPHVDEAHVIDTGSTDGTWHILEGYCRAYPYLKIQQQDVQGLGPVWSHSEKDKALTRFLNVMRVNTKSEWILRVDGDEVFPMDLMQEIRGLEPKDRFYAIYFYHIENGKMLNPFCYRQLRALRLFRKTGGIYWSRDYGQETLLAGKTFVSTRKCPALEHRFLHLGSYRKGERKHSYHYAIPERIRKNCGPLLWIPVPEEYQHYVPYNS